VFKTFAIVRLQQTRMLSLEVVPTTSATRLADHEFSVGYYLFTVSNPGLLFCHGRPSQQVRCSISSGDGEVWSEVLAQNKKTQAVTTLCLSSVWRVRGTRCTECCLLYLSVCRDLCTKVVGVTSSEGFRVFLNLGLPTTLSEFATQTVRVSGSSTIR